jgi:hypothetical protein
MASTYSALKIELIGTGEQSGTWGTTTNENLGTAIEQAIVGKADVTVSSTSVTLTLTDSNALQNARALYLNLSGTPGGAATLNVPAIEKNYIVKNGTNQAVTIKVTGQTGVTIPVGKTVLVYNNATDVVTAIDYVPSLTTPSATISGGTITGITQLEVAGTNSAGAQVRLFEDTDNGTNYVDVKAPDSLASNVVSTLPATTTTLAGLAVLQTFSVSQRGTVTTDNDGSFDMNATNNFLCTPTGGFALTFTNITAGQSGNIILVNGSNYAITAAAATKVASTTLATISATGTYWLSYYSPDGTNVYVANTGALA